MEVCYETYTKLENKTHGLLPKQNHLLGNENYSNVTRSMKIPIFLYPAMLFLSVSTAWNLIVRRTSGTKNKFGI